MRIQFFLLYTLCLLAPLSAFAIECEDFFPDYICLVNECKDEQPSF